VKLRTAPLDHVHDEVGYVLRSDGRPFARFLLSATNAIYRCHRTVMLGVLRLYGRYRPASKYPEIGHEPFNLSPEDLKAAWEEPRA
jgi:hypothetical protein